MKRYLLALVLLSSCMWGSRPMSTCAFYEVSVGSTQEELVSTLGKPYRIRTNKEGDTVYEYIEKIAPVLYHVSSGASVATVTHYSYVLRDGRVIDKKVRVETPPAWRGDSYDLETTSVEQESSSQKN